MKYKYFIPIIFLCLAGNISRLQAQEATTSAGGDFNSSEGSVSYSVGQIAFSANTSANGSSAEGVQQAYEIYLISSIADRNRPTLQLDIFPNPTAHTLQLNIEDLKDLSLKYELFDLAGSLVQSDLIVSKNTLIEVSSLAQSTYLLQVSGDGQNIQSFKIIKK